MSCADVCLDMDYDSDENDFYREVMRTARKSHRCCECRETIPPGAQYQVATGKSDGRVWTDKTCAACTEIRKTFVCGSWVFGQLWEEIEQVMFPIWNEKGPLDCLAQLDSLEARDKARAMYRNWREDRA